MSCRCRWVWVPEVGGDGGSAGLGDAVGAGAQPIGIALLIVAVAGYGLSNNILVPLQQAHGSPAIIGRALIVGTVLLAPTGVIGLTHSNPTTGSLAAVAVLGVVGTGIARALNATLAGRTGAARGSITTYLVPVVAIVLGVTFRNDTIEAAELIGARLVLAGAYLISRRQRSTASARRACAASRHIHLKLPPSVAGRREID